MTEPNIPTATLAYERADPHNALRVVRRVVGILGIAFGILQLTQLVGVAVLPMVFSDGFGQLTLEPMPLAILFGLYLFTGVAGAILLIVSGRRVSRNDLTARRSFHWGAILVGISLLARAGTHSYQLFTHVFSQPGGVFAYFLYQTTNDLLSSLLLPAFLAYVAARNHMLRTEQVPQ